MFAKKINYTDFNGNENNETLYFNLTKLEAAKLLDKYGDLNDKLANIIEKEDLPAMIKLLSDIVLSSYGIKSEDGKRFIKNAKIREEFEESIAFAELIDMIITEPDLAKEFGNEIMQSTTTDKQIEKNDKQSVDYSSLSKEELLALLKK